MTVIPPHVAMLRELVAKWNRAFAAGDLDRTRYTGAELVGLVEGLLHEHDAESDSGESE